MSDRHGPTLQTLVFAYSATVLIHLIILLSSLTIFLFQYDRDVEDFLRRTTGVSRSRDSREHRDRSRERDRERDREREMRERERHHHGSGGSRSHRESRR